LICENFGIIILFELLFPCFSPRVSDVLCFALFTAATLEVHEDLEKEVTDQGFNKDGTDLEEDYQENTDNQDQMTKKQSTQNNPKTDRIILRNRCLKLFHSLLYCANDGHGKNSAASEVSVTSVLEVDIS
jgi:hypothetical protein